MVILAALPGMVSELLVTGKIVHPGNFEGFVNLLGSRLRQVGLATCRGEDPLCRAVRAFASRPRGRTVSSDPGLADSPLTGQGYPREVPVRRTGGPGLVDESPQLRKRPIDLGQNLGGLQTEVDRPVPGLGRGHPDRSPAARGAPWAPAVAMSRPMRAISTFRRFSPRKKPPLEPAIVTTG